jgi:hypothetical protein
MAKLGKIIGGIVGGGVGFLVGGPAGAALGATILGGAGHGLDVQSNASRSSKREMLRAGEYTREAANRADKVAKDQTMANEKALQKISQGRVRAANRRVRGGLFGDTGTSQQYGSAQKLGG